MWLVYVLGYEIETLSGHYNEVTADGEYRDLIQYVVENDMTATVVMREVRRP